MCHRGAFAQGSPATRRLHLSAQLLLARCVLADAHASPVPGPGFGTRSAPGARRTRRRRKRDLPAWDPRDALATRTGPLPPRKVQNAIRLGKKRPHGRPRTGAHGHALLRPVGPPWAGHVPPGASARPPAGGFGPRLRPPLPDVRRWRSGRADYPLPRYGALPIHRTVLLEAGAGVRAAVAAMPEVGILARAAPVRGAGLLAAPPPRLPVLTRGGFLKNR